MKKLIISIAAALAVVSAGAQELNKQLEVTREYVPQVEQADKLPVEPTALTKSEMQLQTPYRITSTARPTPFTPELLKPVVIEGQEDDPEKIYIRLGAGLPVQTTADFYYTPKMPRGSTLGFFANHRGEFSNFRNDLKVTAAADEWLAGAGVFGSHEINRFVLTGDATFDHRSYTLYGLSAVDVRPFFAMPTEAQINRFFSIDAETQNRIGWTGVRGGVSFGDTFTDLRHLNFKVTLGLGFMPQADQADIDLGVKLGQLFGRLDGLRQGFEARVWERSANVKDGKGAFTLGIEPRYVLEGGRVRLTAGADLYWLQNKAWAQRSAMLFRPAFEIRAMFAEGKVEPFAFYRSTVLDGSLAALTRVNPYSEGTAPTGISGDLRVGIRGEKREKFSYSVSGGVSFLDNYHLFVARQNITVGRDLQSTAWNVFYRPVRFAATGVSGKRYTVGVEVGLENLGKFSARTRVDWNKMKLADTSLVGDLPKFDAALSVDYRRTDKLTFRVGFDWIGRRGFNAFYDLDSDAARLTDENGFGTLRAVLDFSAGAELKITDGFWLWAQGRNLLSQKLYPYPTYNGMGINLMVGAKATF